MRSCKTIVRLALLVCAITAWLGEMSSHSYAENNSILGLIYPSSMSALAKKTADNWHQDNKIVSAVDVQLNTYEYTDDVQAMAAIETMIATGAKELVIIGDDASPLKPVLTKARDAGIKVVVTSKLPVEISSVTTLVADPTKYGKAAADTLVALGIHPKSVLVVEQDPGSNFGAAFEEGWKAALSEGGLSPEIRRTDFQQDWTGGDPNSVDITVLKSGDITPDVLNLLKSKNIPTNTLLGKIDEADISNPEIMASSPYVYTDPSEVLFNAAVNVGVLELKGKRIQDLPADSATFFYEPNIGKLPDTTPLQIPVKGPIRCFVPPYQCLMVDQ